MKSPLKEFKEVRQVPCAEFKSCCRNFHATQIALYKNVVFISCTSQSVDWIYLKNAPNWNVFKNAVVSQILLCMKKNCVFDFHVRRISLKES